MTPDRARQAVAAAIVATIPDSTAEMLAGWTEGQWRGFLVALATTSPPMWEAVERRDLVGLMAAAAEEAPPELPEIPRLEDDNDTAETIRRLDELLGLEECPTCRGVGGVPKKETPPPPARVRGFRPR